jgi:phosphoribosylaminoimidazolecarboxamide formyltransferase/IMP cyclohydrolase
MKRALISVSDKSGLLPLARALKRWRIEIISTGGTEKFLKSHSIRVRSVSSLTGFPEILGGRVKTLHPKIFGGLLYERRAALHRKTAREQGIQPIDLVVVNLYAFGETVAKKNVSLADAVKSIDIGGPAMLRAASKNLASVAALCDPADYGAFIFELNRLRGGVSEKTCAELAAKCFQHTAAYDQAVAHYFRKKFVTSDGLPETLDVTFRRTKPLRYGENPHQRAALYQRVGAPPRFSFRQLHGKELSYNNMLDLDAAVDIMREFREPAACVVKHTSPCGIASNASMPVAIEQAVACDPLSAFGGIVGVNRALTEEGASTLLGKLGFFELLVAPKIAPRALALLKARKNLRVIEVPHFDQAGPYDLRYVKSGVLLQDRDEPIDKRLARFRRNLKMVTKAKPSDTDMHTLLFAWRAVKVTKSNAIVLAQGSRTVGIGGGLASRIDAVKLACDKAGEGSRGSVLASDAFFPMPDNIEIAHLHGVRAIIQPGGSIRDREVIEACNRYGIAMVFTGERHFKH